MVAGAFFCWTAATAAVLLLTPASNAEYGRPFQLPTANNALFERGAEEKFFVPTVGKTWESGCFGCVRSDGWQMHEGLDIRCLTRDKRGEPTDPVMAAAEGVVVYITAKPALSRYGKYIVVRHKVDGLEIYSLYAHLSEIHAGLKTGAAVKAGDVIGTMGRTTNDREPITRDRAHVHFELNLLANDRFEAWFKKTSPTERNDHGQWNGQNMLGLDPRLILLGERDKGKPFDLLNFIQTQTELCTVFVRKTDFPWTKRYAALARPNPVAEREGIAGYELSLNFNGVPFSFTPRAASEIKGRKNYQLLHVNEAEYRKNPCRRLIAQRSGRWELTARGTSLLDLLTY